MDSDQKTNTNVVYSGAGGGQPAVSDFGVVPDPGDPEALSLEPESLAEPSPEQRAQAEKHTNFMVRLLKRADVLLVGLLLLGLVGLIVANVHKRSNVANVADVSGQFDTVKLPLGGLVANEQGVSLGTGSVVINGSLKLNDGLVIAPSLQPNTPIAGQLYYDQNTNQLAYFNGTAFVPLSATNQVVQSIGGVSGQLTLGGGLTVVGNQLNSVNNGVTSLGGQTGAITLGSGLSLAGNTLQNGGALSITAGSNITVTNDGKGNYTITNTGAGTGTVTSPGGTAGQVAMFDGAQNIVDSLISQSGTTVTIVGDLNVVTGGLSLGNALTVSNGGTGATSLASNGVVVGNGTAAFTAVTAGGPGLCLLSTAGAPAFGACPGNAGVTTLNGLSGVLTIANASGAGSTITLDNATTGGTKGISSFNATNFTTSVGVVNTIQDINTAATPSFGRLTVTSSQAAAAMLLVNNTNTSGSGNLLDLQLNGASRFSVQPGGNVTATGTINGQTISSSANFTGTLGVTGNTTLTGTLAVNGGTINSTGGLSLTPGGTLTAGSSGQTLTLQGNGSSTIAITGGGNTTTISFQAPTANVTYRVPTAAAGSYDICTTAGNCTGTGGGVTTAGGTANRLAKFNSAQVIADSTISDNGSLVTTTANIAIQGGTATVGIANSQTGSLVLAYGSANFSGTVTQGTLTNNRTYTLPDQDGTVCLSSGNCLGPGGSGANTALSNLSSVAINTSLLPGSTSIDLGSSALPFRNLYIAGSSASPATNNFQITGTATAARTITLPDATGTVCLNNASSCGFATGSGSAFVQSGNSFGATGVLGTNDNNGLNIRTNGTTALALSAAGNATFSGTVTINGSSLSSAGALNVTPGGTLTVGATGQTLTLQGNASSTLSATGGGFTTTIGFSGSPTAAVTYNFDRSVANGTYTICTTIGNCAGTGGGVTTAGGTTGTLAVFTAAQTIGDSLLSQGAGTITVAGNLSLTTGSTYQINGTQISSANLSNDSNLAKLSASQTFTGATQTFKNASDSTNALSIQNAAGSRLLTANTTAGTIVLGTGSTLDGKLVFSNMSNGNTVTILPGTPSADRQITLPNDSGTICLSTGNCAGAGATLQTAYNFSVGGTTPKIKLNSSLNGVDIQDADTTIGVDLLDVRASNGSGLGAVLFGVGNTGQITMQNSANSTTALQVLTLGGTKVATVDTSAGRLVLGQGGTLVGKLALSNATNSNTGTIQTSVLGQDTVYTLPDPSAGSATICLQNSSSCGFASSSGSGNYIQNQNSSAQTTANFWISGNGRADGSFLAPSFDVGSAGALAVGNTTATSINIGKTGSNILTTVNGQTLLKPVTNSTIAVRAQDANGTAVVNVDTTSSNLITNSTFETNGATGWTGHGGAAAPTQSILAHYDNDGSLAVVTTASGHGTQYNFALAASTQYSFSVFAKASGSNFTTFEIGYSSDGSTDTSCATGQTVSTAQWLRITCTFTTGSVSGTRYVYAKQTDATGRTFYLDAAQLETAAAPTPYRNAKLSLGNSVLINGGPLDAAASTAALQVNALSQGKGLVVYGSGENSVFTTILDVRSADDTTSFFHVNETSRETDILGGSSFLGTPALNITPIETAATALRASGIASATAPLTIFKAGATPGAGATLLSLQDSGGLVHGAFNTIGNQLTLGRIASSGTVSQGQIVLSDGTTSNFGATINTTGTLSGNSTFQLGVGSANGTYQICTTLSVCAGYASSSSAANTSLSNLSSVAINTALGFQANQTATINFASTATTGNALNITGQTGSSGNGGAIGITAGSGSASGGTVTIQGGGAGSGGTNGGVTIDTGTGASSSNGTVSVGATNAATVTIGNSSAATTIQGSNGAGAVSIQAAASGTISIGTTNNNVITLGNTGSTSGLTLGQSTASNTITIGNATTATGNTQTVNIATSATGTGKAAVTIGNTNGASSLLLQGGTGNVQLKSNGTTFVQNANDGATAFQVQDTGSAPLINVNTLTRTSGVAGNMVKIGNSTGTDTALTFLQLDSTTTDPTTNLASVNGGLFYNSTTNKVSLIENGQVKIICNTTDLGCGTGTVTLQTAYNNSTGSTTPEIKLDGTRAGLDIQDADSTIGANLLNVRASNGSGLGSTLFGVGSTGQVTMQNSTNSNAAFLIQNASGSNQVNVNTLAASNQVLNGDFEANTTAGWLAKGTAGTPTIVTTPVKFGRYALELVTGNASDNGAQYNVGLRASTQYSLSLWARRSTSSAASFNIGRADNGTDTDCLTNQTLNTTYTQFTCTFTTGSTIGSASHIYIKQTDTSTDTIEIDGVTLVASATAMTYQSPGAGLEVAPAYNQLTINSNGANPELQPWQLSSTQITTNGSTAANRSRAATVTYNGYIYVLGGGTAADGLTVASTNNALYAKLNADGSVGAFAATTNLNTAVTAPGAVVINGYMYVVGGRTGDANNTTTTIVQYARINSDGTLGSWSQTTAALTAARQNMQVVTYNGYLYVVGGADTVGDGQNTTYYAKANSDGNITAWTTGTTLTSAPSGHGVIVNNGYIYTIGSNLFNTTIINYARLNANGSIGTWTANPTNLPSALGDGAFATLNGYVYAIGGYDQSNILSTVSYAPFNTDGTIGSWTSIASSLPRVTENNRAVVANGYIYTLGGDTTSGTVLPSIYYTSGPRTKITGALDLVGTSGKTLADTDGGGQLTAGDTNIVGSLQVQGNAAFKQGLSVGAGLSVGGEINGGSWSGGGLTDCDASNSKLLYDVTTKQFSCGTDRASVTLRKSADQSVASSTFTSDDTFTFTAGANETWAFQINTVFQTSGASNPKFQISAPASSTCRLDVVQLESLVNGSATSCGTSTGGINHASDTSDMQYLAWGTVVTSGTGGTVAFQWARNNGTDTITERGSTFMIAYKISGADVAEAYYTKQAGITPGDIVRVDGSLPAGVQKTTGAYDSQALGIVSTKPGMVLGDNSQAVPGATPVLLALNGRIPVKVSLENGPIEPGDYLTTSSIPGVAMKATQPGQMIGKALEGFNDSNPSAKGMVMTFANLTWADPHSNVTANSDLQAGAGTAATMNVAGMTTTQNLTVTGTATVKSLVVGDMVSTKDITVNGAATFAGDINLNGVGQSRNAITKRFKASAPIAIGSVVIADPANDGQVTTTNVAGDTRVLGVALTEANAAGEEITVAIGGSVQVRTMTGTAIQGGDLLVSSPQPGLVEKSTAPAPGSLVGKSLGRPSGDLTWMLITLD